MNELLSAGMTSTVNSKNDIFALLQANKDKIRALGVKRFGLFGSFMRGEQTVESDIDLIVEYLPGEKNFDHFMELCFFLENLLQRRVELVTAESLSPHIGPRILQNIEYVPFAA